jgi:hypothetical protein
MLPERLIAHLIATGRHNPDGVHRGARLTHCADCGRPILSGLDGDIAGWAVKCDPHEIDTRGELVALALNLRTFMLTRATNSSGKSIWNLDPRTQWSIAAGQRTAIVAQHRCGIAVPTAAVSHLPIWVTRAATTTTDQPPF